MEKIPTMYSRDESVRGHPVVPGVKPECAWVEAGEGVATRKIDGMNVKVENRQLLKRQKPKDREYDRASYAPCSRNNPTDKYLFEAFDNSDTLYRRDYGKPLDDGIYEAVGPKIQGNTENLPCHVLISVVPVSPSLHAGTPNDLVPRDFDGLRSFLSTPHGGGWGFERQYYEGLVFHHLDGRLAKIKRRDFGLSWPVKE